MTGSGSGARRQLIAEADGAARHNPGPASYGALVRDPHTHEVLAFDARQLGETTNNVAEYSGLVAALTLARDIDPDARIEVRMDSKLVVEQMSGRWKIKDARLQQLAMQARGVVDPAQVHYTWIPRDKNKGADALGNAVLDGVDLARALVKVGERLSASGVGEQSVNVIPPVVSPELSLEPAATPAPATTPAADLGQPLRLVLIRHGVTDLTVARVMCGSRTDPPLNAHGLAQAKLAAAAVKRMLDSRDITPVAVVHSPMRRTTETAAAVTALYPGIVAAADADLVECDFGVWEGITMSDIVKQEPELSRRWLAGEKVAPEDGESLPDVAARAAQVRGRLLAHYPGSTVVVVTHATPVRMMVAAALGVAPPIAMSVGALPASISVAEFYSDGVGSLVSLNGTDHLIDL